MIPVFDKTGPYIWAAYGASLLVIVLLIIAVLLVTARARRGLAKLEAMDKDEIS